MSTGYSSIDQHPDILALRADYGRAAESLMAQAVFGVALLAAIYAAISPWVVGFSSNRALTINDLIVGVGGALLALGLGWAFDRTHGLTWAMPLVGIWLIISPWVVRGGITPSTGIESSNPAAGAVLGLAGLAIAYFAFGVGSRGERMGAVRHRATAR